MHRVGWLPALSVVFQLPCRALALRTGNNAPLGRTLAKVFGSPPIVLLLVDWLMKLLLVTELGNDVVQFFERDEPPPMAQLVLIDRLGQLDDFGPKRAARIDELAAFAPLFAHAASLATICEGRFVLPARTWRARTWPARQAGNLNDFLHFNAPR
jgi:hypothetical protein